MLFGPRGHGGRRNLVAYIAVLIALGGTAYAAKPLIATAKTWPALVGPRFIAWREAIRA